MRYVELNCPRCGDVARFSIKRVDISPRFEARKADGSAWNIGLEAELSVESGHECGDQS